MAKFVMEIGLNSKVEGGKKKAYLFQAPSKAMKCKGGNGSFTKNKIFMLLTYIKQKMECFLQGNYFL